MPIAEIATSQGISSMAPSMGTGDDGRTRRLAELHLLDLDGAHGAVLAGDKLERGDERQNLDALGLSVVQLGATAGHLVLSTAVSDDGVLGAQTLGGTDGVHSHVAATKDDDVPCRAWWGCRTRGTCWPSSGSRA